jgi:L-alanine-DL-glutamate epimerase-like enolase superfamily enzyme
MKITDVKLQRVLVPARSPAFRWREGLPGSEPDLIGGLLRVRADDGTEGIALTERGAIVEDLVQRRLRHELIGADPFDREWLWHRAWEIDRIEEFPIYALGLVDVALWDLASKALGVPTYQLIGGFRKSLPAYASTSTFTSVEEYLDVVDQCLGLGYGAIKLHGWGDARRDAALAQTVRSHVGDAVDLMYDGSAGFDLPDAIYVGRSLGAAGFRWYEEPMREFSITAYKWLAERVEVPLLVGETSDGAHMNMADFMAAGCASYVRMGTLYKGGFTGALRIAHTADSFRLRAEAHGGGQPNLHLCMAVPNTTYYESLVTSNPVVREPLVDADGRVRAPTRPGVGIVEEELQLLE